LGSTVQAIREKEQNEWNFGGSKAIESNRRCDEADDDPSAARADVELALSKKEGAQRNTMATPQAVQ
jgi:hypothetical protein